MTTSSPPASGAWTSSGYMGDGASTPATAASRSPAAATGGSTSTTSRSASAGYEPLYQARVIAQRGDVVMEIWYVNNTRKVSAKADHDPRQAAAGASVTEQPGHPWDSGVRGIAAPEILATPKEPRRVNRRLVVGGCAVLALAVVAGGSVWALDRLGEADRTAPTVVWAEPKGGSAGDDKATPPKGLAASVLLPVPHGYELGPDIGEYGNDTELNERQAIAVLKEGGRDLPSARSASSCDKAVDKLKLQGVAMRSYRISKGGLVIGDPARRRSRTPGSGPRTGRTSRASSSDVLGIFRKGPADQGPQERPVLPAAQGVRGQSSTPCSAPPTRAMSWCSATAYGVKPFDTKEAATMLSESSSTVSEVPGEAV